MKRKGTTRQSHRGHTMPARSQGTSPARGSDSQYTNNANNTSPTRRVLWDRWLYRFIETRWPSIEYQWCPVCSRGWRGRWTAAHSVRYCVVKFPKPPYLTS